MRAAASSKSMLRLVPRAEGRIDADWAASRVMEAIDQVIPGFWNHHPITDRGIVRNIIARVVAVEDAKR